MKKYIVILAALITLSSCTKNQEQTNVVAPLGDKAYVLFEKITYSNYPEPCTRFDYTVSDKVAEVYLMVNANDGHGWVQRQGEVPKSAAFLPSDYYKYFFHLILKDNSIFDTQKEIYLR